MHIIVISFVWIDLYVYVLCTFNFTYKLICYMFHDLSLFPIENSHVLIISVLTS